MRSEDRDPAATVRVVRPPVGQDMEPAGDRGGPDLRDRRGVARPGRGVARPVIDPWVPGPTELPVHPGPGRPIAVARRALVDLAARVDAVDLAARVDAVDLAALVDATALAAPVHADPTATVDAAHPEARVTEGRPAGRVPMTAAGATGRRPARGGRCAAMTRRRVARCRAARARGPRIEAQAPASTVHRTGPAPTDRTAAPNQVPMG